MKVLWIADFGIKHNIGGAQRTNEYIIEEGVNQGHKITQFNYDSPLDLLTEEYDLVVSGNLEGLYKSQPVFSYIIKHPNHVRYEHDSNSYLPQKMREELFASAKHSLFLSQYHHEVFKELYGDIFHGVDVVTSPIDTEIFKDCGEDREEAILYIGYMHIFKGTQNFFNYVLKNPDKKFVMASWGDSHLEKAARCFKNIRWLGKRDYKEMPAMFNQYTEMYYHPEKFEPFCRAVGEALLCGIKVNASENIGAMDDYNKYGIDALRQMCSGAAKKFWEIVNDNGNTELL